jgi:hypothetical protein
MIDGIPYDSAGVQFYVTAPGSAGTTSGAPDARSREEHDEPGGIAVRCLRACLCAPRLPADDRYRKNGNLTRPSWYRRRLVAPSPCSDANTSSPDSQTPTPPSLVGRGSGATPAASQPESILRAGHGSVR